MNKYKNGKYKSMFSDIDVDLRNSYIHGIINFPNNKSEYYNSKEVKKTLPLGDFLSKYKKLPALHAMLFSYRLKVFLNEMVYIAKQRGFL